MTYKKADECLPEDLIREVQKYVDGELIYFPAKGKRKTWGSLNGTKEALNIRNGEIRALYDKGSSIETLSKEFCLSAESIRKIIKQGKESL